MILLVPDKFKGSLTAQQVCEAMTQGLLTINPSLDIVSIPFADGGEGTAQLLAEFTGGSMIPVTVRDPLFREIKADYGISGDGSTAFIEMAKASGLQLLKKEERNPRITTTFGTGQLIADALARKVKKIVLGVGGSATTDAGMGMAEALGFQFLSSTKTKLKPIGENLHHMVEMKEDRICPGLRECEFTVIFDVANPLHGSQGAAYIFSGQKGASASDIEFLDHGLAHVADVVARQFGMDINFAGAGAGGGLAGMAKLILKARFVPGIDFMLDFTRLEEKIKDASLILTGEGKIDDQTLSGKVVMGVGQLCAKHKKKCIAFAGRNELPDNRLSQLGLEAIISIVGRGTNEDLAMREASSLLQKKVTEALPAYSKYLA